MLGAASQRPPKHGTRKQGLPIAIRPPGRRSRMRGPQPPSCMPILCSHILHPPSLVQQKMRATPARTTPWGLCCVPVTAGGRGTWHWGSDGKKALGIFSDRGATALRLGRRAVWERQTVRPLRKPPRVQLAQTQHCDGLDFAGPLPAQRSEKHNLSVLLSCPPVPVSN